MKYTKTTYPDGQISAKVQVDELDKRDHTQYIHERINSYEDLIYVVSIADALRSAGFKEIVCVIPCLFGQRSDMRFKLGQSFDLKIITNIINTCGFVEVRILDPHSPVSLGLVNNSIKLSPIEFVRKADADILSREKITPTFIAPDAGAYKKVFGFGEELNRPVISAVKHRSLEGKVHLEFTGQVRDRVCLIVDDLCDGGYTFTSLAKALRANHAARVYLYVSHGYFSKGFVELQKDIDHIYCTNSVMDITNDFVTQFRVI